VTDGWVVYSLEDAEQVYTTRLHELTKDEWARLGSALAQVEAADSSGSWRAQRQLPDGTWELLASSLSTEAAGLMGALDELAGSTSTTTGSAGKQGSSPSVVQR